MAVLRYLTHPQVRMSPEVPVPRWGLSDEWSVANRDPLVVGHGGVGTLLWCHLASVPISRTEDQVGGEAAPGGGNYWAYDIDAGRVMHRWRPIDA